MDRQNNQTFKSTKPMNIPTDNDKQIIELLKIHIEQTIGQPVKTPQRLHASGGKDLQTHSRTNQPHHTEAPLGIPE